MSPFSLFLLFRALKESWDVRPQRIVVVHPPKRGKRRSICGPHLEELGQPSRSVNVENKLCSPNKNCCPGGQSQHVHSGKCCSLSSVAVLQQHPATLTLVSESCFCKTTRCLLSGTHKHLLFKVFEQTANAVVFLARTVLLYLCTLLLYPDSMSLKHFL